VEFDTFKVKIYNMSKIRFGFLLLCLVLMDYSSNAQQAFSNEIPLIKMTEPKLKRPNYLKKGDTIALVAPSGVILDNQPILKGISILKSWGLQVITGPNVYGKNGHFSSSDDLRLQDLQWALDDSSIDAIWAARGGYGTARIIDNIDFTKFLENPKWIIGYSDITVLHNAINNLGVESIHGIMPINMSDDEQDVLESMKSLHRALFGEKLVYNVDGSPYNREGRASGILVGGNLTLLQTMLGTPTDLDVSERVLFFEEIGEYDYHLDRMLRQMDRNGYFKNCKGVVVGGISKARVNSTAFGMSTEELILEVFKNYDIPIIFNFPAGHESLNMSLILGRTVSIKSSHKESKIRFKN
jgi:muramoyltetrapeptide carboxypeptidase